MRVSCLTFAAGFDNTSNLRDSADLCGQVKLSKVAAIMASRKAAQKMKPKVAAPVEGQFESAEESEQKYSAALLMNAGLQEKAD